MILDDVISTTNMVGSLCSEAGSILKFIGVVLTIVKISIPILIVVLGLFDFSKAVVSSEDKEIKKQSKRLMYRILAGIIIFFVPTIVMFVFGTISTYNDATNSVDFSNCKNCILTPYGKGDKKCDTSDGKRVPPIEPVPEIPKGSVPSSPLTE